MPYKGFVGNGYVGHFQTVSALNTQYPPDMYAGRRATVESAGTARPYYSDGATWSDVSLGGGVLTPYKGIVASRCKVQNSKATGNGFGNCRSKHVAKDTIKTISVVHGAWYVLPGSTESNLGNSITYKIGVEYNGTVTPLTWSGSTSGTIADGATLESDAVTLPVAIPAGATFYLRTNFTSSGAFAYGPSGLNVNAQAVTDTGEALEFSASSLGDKSLTGTITNTLANSIILPLAILGQTSKPTFMLCGDSRLQTGPITDSVTDQSGLLGYVERNVGQTNGVLNAAIYGTTLQASLGAGFTKRLPLAAYCSHVICNYGINDITINRTLVQLKADAQTFISMFPATMPFYWCTAEPVTTSTDSWATTVNQTLAPNNSVRVAWNDALRVGIPRTAGVVEIADIVESARNSGLWKVTGAANAYTADGTHANTAGNALGNGAYTFTHLKF